MAYKPKKQAVSLDKEEVSGGSIDNIDNSDHLNTSTEHPKSEQIHHSKHLNGSTNNNHSANSFKEKITHFLNDKYNLGFLVVLVIGFLLRLKYINQESIWNDSAVHLWYAIKVTLHPLFIFSREYILGDYVIPQTIMAFFYFFTKNILLAGKINTLLYFVVGMIFIYLLGKELRSKFTGLMAATLLAFNHIFWFYSVRPLADSPLLVTTIILLYGMVKLEKEKTMRWAIISGFMFLACMFTKGQSSLYIFALVIYYLIFKRTEMIHHKPTLVSWLIPVGSVFLAHIVGKLFFHAAILDRIFALFVDMRGMPFGLESLGMLQWIFSWYLVPFVIIGILFVIAYKEKQYYFGLVLLLFYYLFFEVNVDNTQDRYILPLLSVGILLAVFAIEEMAAYLSMFTHKNLKHILVIIVIIFISWNYYQAGDPLIYNKTFSYLGYQEAGQWIKDNVPVDAPIFAGEYRSIRLFAEREYAGPIHEENGGTIWNLRSPFRYTEDNDGDVGKSNFENDVSNLSKNNDVYLEVDIWEYAQPKWYWPLSQESINYFQSLGFKPMKVVERDVQTQDGLKKMPVIIIFKKDKVIS